MGDHWLDILAIVIPILILLVTSLIGLYVRGVSQNIEQLGASHKEDIDDLKTTIRECKAGKCTAINTLSDKTQKIALEVKGLTSDEHRREQKKLNDALTELTNLLRQDKET